MIVKLLLIFENYLTYRITSNNVRTQMSLINRGANGGFAGQDVRLLETSSKLVDIIGIEDHAVQNLPLCTVAGVATTQHGLVCVMMHQYAYHGKGRTVHSSLQLEAHGIQVDDRSSRLGGKQCLTT